MKLIASYFPVPFEIAPTQPTLVNSGVRLPPSPTPVLDQELAYQDVHQIIKIDSIRNVIFPTNTNVTPKVNKTLTGDGVMKRRINKFDRLRELKKVREGRLTAVQAGINLGLSRGYIFMLLKRLKLEGPRKLLGRTSRNRISAEVKDKALGLILTTYSNFSPTLAHKYLTEREGLRISVVSVRHIMVKNEIWPPKSVSDK